MLSSNNTGKYLNQKWHKERADAMRNSAVSGDYSQDELELTNTQIGGVNNPETYQIETSPVDQFTDPKTYDIRKGDTIGD